MLIGESISVSVVVPTFNRLGLLRQTLASLHQQTLLAAEFVIVDDGSDTATLREIDDFVSRDPRFRLLAKPAELKRGCQTSKNYAIPRLLGKYVVFLDSDDLLAPNALADRAAFLDANGGVDLAVGEQVVLFENSGKVMWLNSPTLDENDLDRFLRLTQPLDIPWVNGGVAVRLAALRDRKLGYRAEFRWEDAVFHFECLCRGMRAAWMPRTGRPDCFYRIHGESMGSDLWTAAGIRNCAEMLLWMAESLKSQMLLNSVRLAALQRCCFHLTVLRAVDHGDYALAVELVHAQEGILGRELLRSLRRFIRLRKWLRWSRRAGFYVNSWLRTRHAELFSQLPETYGCEPCAGLHCLDDLREIVDGYTAAASVTT